MGLFDRFRRRPAAAAPEAMPPQALRDAYFRAFARLKDDPRPLNQLITKHFGRIVSEATGWSIVPEPIRGDRVAANAYVEALVWLAHQLKEMGHPALYDKLAGTPADNPILRWQAQLDEAGGLAKDLKFDEAIELLNNALIDFRHLRGPGADHQAALTHGLLGHLCFNVARMQLARGHYETALRLCEQAGDAEGVGVYLLRLHHAHRYLGDGEAAAGYAERAAAGLEAEGKAAEAKWYRRQGEIYRSGAPLLRVIARAGGVSCELEDQERMAPDSELTLFFERNRPSLGLCDALVKRGGELGAKDQFYEALGEFRAAAEADPFDPQPRYEEGHTLMNLGRHAEAVAAFDAVESLAPGWFNSRGDRWLAEEIAAGRAPHEAFVLLRFQDVGPEVIPFEKRLELADAALRRTADLAPLHLFRGRMLEGLGRSADAAAAYRAGLARAAEPDVKSRLLLHLHTTLDDDEERVRVLRETIALRDTGNLMAASMALVSLRSMG